MGSDFDPHERRSTNFIDSGIGLSIPPALTVRAIMPGSFDPFTLGHKDIARRAGKLYSEVVIGIGVNPAKNPMFSVEEKIALIKEELKDVEGNFKVVAFEGLLAHYAVSIGASVIVRGVRGITDTDVESQLASINREQAGFTQLDTCLLPARYEYHDVSSSASKELIKNGGNVSNYVSPLVELAMRNKLAGKSGDDLFSRDLSKSIDIKTAEKIVFDRWMQLAKRLRVTDSSASQIGKKILDAYKEPQRKYHDLMHIAEGLLSINGFRDEIAALDAFELAWFYHDIVYDPADTQKGSNEQKSKQCLLDTTIDLGIPLGILRRASEFIDATIDHKSHESDSDCAFFTDNDLWILGSSSERYQKYTADLRQEYNIYDDLAFNSGRAKFLCAMLQRERIYKTDYFASTFEEKVKPNLEHELQKIVWGSVLAVTGSIGSGKSTVMQILKDQGFQTQSADLIAEQLRQPGTDTYDKIVAHFGKEVLNPDQSINRKALGRMIFADPQQRIALESIMHPAIQQVAFEEFLQDVINMRQPLAYEVPILFEAGLESRGFKKILFVSADLETRVARIIARDGCTEEQAMLKINSQLPDAEKIDKSDIVIHNDSDVDSLSRSLLQALFNHFENVTVIENVPS